MERMSFVKNLVVGVMTAGLIAATTPIAAQMHKVTQPQQVVRAVGVYEWTGDKAKPTASRLIPVSVFINDSLQDAGVYLARPVPFALLTGNEYELQKAGIGQGLFDVESARRAQTADGDYDSGWTGNGSFHAEVAPKAPVLRPTKTLPVIVTSGGDSRPHFGKNGDASSGQAGSSTKPEAGNEPAGDPDRPTMRRQTSATADQTASAGSTPSNEPADDPDRPTLKRRSPQQAKKAKEEAESSGTGAVESLNNDPNRPNLHYGKPTTSSTEVVAPRLVGLPKDLHQMVAVSDAVDREPHDFARPWEDAAERTAVLKKMEAMAQVALAEYDKDNSPAPAPALSSKPTAHHRRSAKTVAPAPPMIALMGEQLKGYTLSYGGAATYVFMAHTAGTGAALRYVTVVAQANDLGELKPALQRVTDEAHLDRAPQMKFIDVVDAEASNRASLLFELRAQNSRQFALYRVIAAQAEPIFITGSMQ